MKFQDIKFKPLVLTLFDANTNVTTQTGAGQDLSAEMKVYYSDYLIDNAEPELVHAQFGQTHPLPKGRGKSIEFRKYSPLPKALTPLTEGVTPAGRKLDVSTVTAEIAQYGDFVEISDLLVLTAIDNQMVEATALLGSQAGRTRDTIVREVLNAGTNVQYAEGQVSSRANLVGGSATAGENHYLTTRAIRMAVRFLRVMNAQTFADKSFAGIIHPDVAFDIHDDPQWREPKSYCDPADLYNGEIGKIEGVRFSESSEAKVWEHAAKDKSTGTATANARDVYSTLIMGANAYGITDLEGGGLQHFVKQLGSAGSADPINQRATVGWKMAMAVERLVEPFMIRIETTSSFNS